MLAAASLPPQCLPNRVATIIFLPQRSLYVGWCNNCIFIFDSNSSHPFNFEIFLKWGIILALLDSTNALKGARKRTKTTTTFFGH
jgi:hypothetical protein